MHLVWVVAKTFALTAFAVLVPGGWIPIAWKHRAKIRAFLIAAAKTSRQRFHRLRRMKTREETLTEPP